MHHCYLRQHDKVCGIQVKPMKKYVGTLLVYEHFPSRKEYGIQCMYIHNMNDHNRQISSRQNYGIRDFYKRDIAWNNDKTILPLSLWLTRIAGDPLETLKSQEECIAIEDRAFV